MPIRSVEQRGILGEKALALGHDATVSRSIAAEREHGAIEWLARHYVACGISANAHVIQQQSLQVLDNLWRKRFIREVGYKIGKDPRRRYCLEAGVNRLGCLCSISFM